MFWWNLGLALSVLSGIALAFSYFIVRIVDGNWTDWKLPVIFGIVYIFVVTTLMTICKLIDFKHRTGAAIYE